MPDAGREATARLGETVGVDYLFGPLRSFN
jgi:hypothetical protein